MRQKSINAALRAAIECTWPSRKRRLDQTADQETNLQRLAVRAGSEGRGEIESSCRSLQIPASNYFAIPFAFAPRSRQSFSPAADSAWALQMRLVLSRDRPQQRSFDVRILARPGPAEIL